MHKSRAIRAFERRLFELGCPAGYSQRSIAELAEHFEDLTDARIEDGLEAATACARASEELGEPTVLAERLVASFRQASWWGRHPIIGFCLLPPLLLMLFLPATVLALYGLFLLGNLFSRHAIPLDEFKSAVETAPAAFAEWNNPLLCFIHTVPIAVNTILFCKLVVRSAAGMKWLVVTCAVCSATGFFTWTGFSANGFYLGYGSPSVYNWLSAAVPVFIAAAIMVWRRRRLSLIGISDSERGEPSPQPAFALHEPSNKHAAPMELERGSREVDSYRQGAPREFYTPAHGPNACAERNEALPEQPGEKSPPKVRRPRILLKEEWFTPTSAVAAAVVVITFLLVKFVFTHDKADHAKLENLRNRI